MNKREIVKYIEAEKQRALMEVNKEYKQKYTAERIAYVEKHFVSEADVKEIECQLDQAYKAVEPVVKLVQADKTYYENGNGLGTLLSIMDKCMTHGVVKTLSKNLSTMDYNYDHEADRWKTKERARVIEGYNTLLSNVKSFKSAKQVKSYLSEVGYQLPQQEEKPKVNEVLAPLDISVIKGIIKEVK